MASRSTYSSKYRLNYHSSTEIWHYKETKKRSGEIDTAERKMYLHLFFNTQRAADDKTDFNDLLDSLEEELKSDKRITAHEHLYEKYYEVKQTPKRGIVLSHKADAIMQAEKNYGYFALDIIECFEQPGRKRHVGEMTKHQLELYKCFGIEVPT